MNPTTDVRTADVRGPRLDTWALQRIESYLEAHLGESVSLDDLAELTATSRFHFSRCFRSSTGESPMAFLRRRRIERAKLLLARGDRPIAEIAMEVGFYDQSHFSRHFARLVGVPPGRYARAQSRAFAEDDGTQAEEWTA